MGSAAALITFLITHGGAIVSAGMSVAGLATEVVGMFKNAGPDGITAAQFNTFVDKCLGKSDDLDTIINKAKADLAAAAQPGA